MLEREKAFFAFAFFVCERESVLLTVLSSDLRGYAA